MKLTTKKARTTSAAVGLSTNALITTAIAHMAAMYETNHHEYSERLARPLKFA